MKIILAGIIGRYPWGGVTWCSLMYLIGLRQLGHDVYYLEDTCECNYDPDTNALATDPAYALRYINESLTPFDFAHRWSYIDFLGNRHGMSGQQWAQVCESADLLIVLSGGVWTWREEYKNIPRKIFIDSDPGFTQIAINNAQQEPGNEKMKWYVDFFQQYDHLFTFGQNICTAACPIDTNGFQWMPTLQPVTTDLWQPAPPPPRPNWTTVMTWVIESFKDVGGNKDQEFFKVLGLAQLCRAAGLPDIELAVNGPKQFLAEHGWRCANAFDISSNLWRYHGYLTSSRGEFSVAKHTYVKHNTGWFSDRTACYLSAGRPAVVQDTGFSDTIPSGAGLLTWTTVDEAFECLTQVEQNYTHHAKMARELAQEYFSATIVLQKLLDRCI